MDRIAVVNQIVLGYVLALLAVFLNYTVNNQVGLLCAVATLALSYLIEILRINDRAETVFVPASILTILACVAAYAAYFLGIDQHVF